MASSKENPYKRACPEDAHSDKNKEAFTPREYQIEILEAAKAKNTIACLGTGTGKTFIAVMLIKESANDVRLPFDSGGKRIFFLVPTVPLVYQQRDTIDNHTDLRVKGYSGDMNVDSWNKDKWTDEFSKNEVLVMTAEIFRIIVDHAFIPLSKIKLIIIDECHRAQGDHPYRQAMKCFTGLTDSEMPRIFGLSASLINGKCKPPQLEKHLRELEMTLKSSITTASDIGDLQKYGADPDEYLVYYKPYVIETELLSKTRDMIEDMNRRKDLIEKSMTAMMGEFDIIFFDKPIRCLRSLGETLSTLGPWCAYKAAEIFSEELSTVLLKSCNGALLEMCSVVLYDIELFLKYFMEECKKLKLSITKDVESWPNKLKRLLEIFLAIKHSKKFAKELISDINTDFPNDPVLYYRFLKNQDCDNKSNIQICSIIFVEQRITAYVLQQWVLEVKTIFPELDFLYPEFIVGHGSTGIKKTCMSEKQQKKALSDFRQKKCNVLISTCVLEEGMDVQQCNAVIRFDLPQDFRAYVQSKGRARAKNSIYVMMSEMGEKANRFWMDMCNFKTVESILLNKCYNRTIPDDEDIKEHMSDTLIPPYMPYGENGPRITLISSISLINRYCASLPTDMATKLTAKWTIKLVDSDSPVQEYECTLKMPINSPLRTTIVGERMRQKRLAKMAAALKACRLLNEIGELNEHLVPISCLVDKALEEELGPIEEEDGNGAVPGTNRRRQIYDKHVPVFLQNSLPKPFSQSYLHVLQLELVESLPKSLNPRNRPIINPGDSSRGLAILLSKKLPLINSFPVFTKYGKLKVTLSLCENACILNECQIQAIENFHKFVFADALHIDKKKFFSPNSAESQFYVVPINKDNKTSWSIDWKFMNHTENHSYNHSKSQTSKSFDRTVFVENLFKDAVLLRSYTIDSWKFEKPTFHHVVNISDKTPNSSLDSSKYLTFKHYYRDKYNIEIQNDHQPLVETYQTPGIHMWKPIYVSVKETFDDVKLSKTKQRRKDYREYLVPELSIIHPFPSSFFHQVQCLPTILFRLRCLLLGEELRQNVASVGLVGIVKHRNDFNWPYFHLETSDKELKKHLHQRGEVVLIPSNTLIPQDIIKSGHDIISFENRVDLRDHPGPSPSLLLQALTTKGAGDEFDLERLEMIGDSFLKYAMSVKTYIRYSNFDEGKLTRLRSRLIQNLHLYQRAKKRKLGEYLVSTTFSCTSTWLPPCYSVSEEMDIEVINSKSKTESEENSICNNLFFQKQIISDKAVADSVEALIGAYLLSCGQKGALMFMSWLGLNPLPHKKDHEVCKDDFENWPPEPPSCIVGQVPNVQECLKFLTNGFDVFEEKIKYTFKDKALLLQAFTHPSYSPNEITDCYQRLEFLGDAVLDFLITRQLYEDPNDHSPGKLTDLRSALVNNIYFASLAVKYKYNQYIKMLSPSLFGLLQHYLSVYQQSEAFQFFEEYGYNLEEIECFDLDEVEVPKALGDLFESVAGAIYLDSGMSLDTVWKIYYPMIAPAMRHLTEHIPKSPVRELYEALKTKDVFTEIVQKEGKSYVKVTLPNGKEVVGVGPNKKVAKRSAAKRALAELKRQKMGTEYMCV